MKKTWIIIGTLVIAVAVGIGIFYLTKKEEPKTESEMLVDVSGEDFKKKIENKDSFILVVSKDGCPFCEQYYPVLISVLEKYDVTAYRINLTKLSKEEITYLNDIANVSGTPTTVFITNGEEKTTLNRLVGGGITKKTLVSRLKSLGYIK